MKYKFGMIAATLLIVAGLSAFAILRSQNTGSAVKLIPAQVRQRLAQQEADYKKMMEMANASPQPVNLPFSTSPNQTRNAGALPVAPIANNSNVYYQPNYPVRTYSSPSSLNYPREYPNNSNYPGQPTVNAYNIANARYPNSTGVLRANQIVIVNQIRVANDPKVKQDLEQKLKDQLRDEFDVQIAKRSEEISALEQKLGEAKELLEVRKARQDEIILRRFNELTNYRNQDPLSWESETDGNQFNLSLPAPIQPPAVYGATRTGPSMDPFSASNQPIQSPTPGAASPSLPLSASPIDSPAAEGLPTLPSMSAEPGVPAISPRNGFVTPAPLEPSSSAVAPLHSLPITTPPAPAALSASTVEPIASMSGVSDRIDSSLNESAIEILGKLKGESELMAELTPAARKQKLALTVQKFEVLRLRVADETVRLNVVESQLRRRAANQRNRLGVEVNELESMQEQHAKGAVSQGELARQKQKVDDEETKLVDIEGQISLLDLGRSTLMERVVEIERLLDKLSSSVETM